MPVVSVIAIISPKGGVFVFDNEPWHPDQLEDYKRLTTDAERLRFFECNGVDPDHMAEWRRLRFPQPPKPEPEPPASAEKPKQEPVWYKSPGFWVGVVGAAAGVIALFR